MTISSIDQALNVVLTSLIYGSGVWLACAFGFYVVTQQRKKKAARPMLLLAPAVEVARVTPFEVDKSLTREREMIANQSVESQAIEDQGPSIEIIIEQPLLVAPSAEEAEKPVLKAVKRSVEGAVDCFSEQVLLSSVAIVCEPVDWKQWKVADLRKASIARACGVRTRPIGSRRNLPKADLIAQYKQQLKRLTKSSPVLTGEKKEVA